MTEIIDNYEKSVKMILETKGREFGLPYHRLLVEEKETLNHYINLGASVLLTRDKIMSGGSFVQSIVDNKLYEAFANADNIAEKGIKFFAYLNQHIYLDEKGNIN